MGGYGTYLTRLSGVCPAWWRRIQRRDVEDAVPYGQLRDAAISNPQHASEASRAEREKPTLGNVGLTGRDTYPQPAGQRPVLTRQRPRSETAVGDEETK